MLSYTVNKNNIHHIYSHQNIKNLHMSTEKSPYVNRKISNFSLIVFEFLKMNNILYNLTKQKVN